MDQAKIDQILNSTPKTMNVVKYNLVENKIGYTTKTLNIESEETDQYRKQRKNYIEWLKDNNEAVGVERLKNRQCGMPKKERNKYKAAFYSARSVACAREIGWALSYEDWLNWWLATGHFFERGMKPGQYCMRRVDQRLGYTLDNIYCCRNS